MGFVAATVGAVVFVALVLYLLGRKHPVAGAAGGAGAAAGAPVDRIAAGQVERENPGLVQEDVRQMLAAQNALRQRRGAPPMTMADLRQAVAEDEVNRRRGRGPFAEG